MILSKQDYLFYLGADKASLNQKRKYPRLLVDEVWIYQRLLRKCEYWNNCKKNKTLIHKLYFQVLLFRLTRQGICLGFTIGLNCFGPGLSIAHHGTIVVNGRARIGANCRVYPGVNIGVNPGDPINVPSIGDNVYIGPGAKIFGNIQIANDIAIGANAVVNKSFLEAGITIGGVPARKISDKRSSVVKGTQLVNSLQDLDHG
ncbi:serine acetyltransferase [Methanofollis aquaemaris]|uniref:Serine acetyltransferase n=1 Tax=Methanofollis aquaemaris TaxID=126734 RepID=A0A8A3S811_9EURY|nr:serine acetyltransferase [Methanofollis aquaemaris]QSZ67861.1 serine acetyltransferase [Methanofollis aquaemaris]